MGGELIWSRNDSTHEYGYLPVIATKVTENQPIFEVVVKDKQGKTKKLETTSEHPFWIKDVGWLKASLLDSGMTLLDRNNEELEVVSQYLVPNRLETVYNIEVEGFHTYHVGELGTWVHNANCCDFITTPKGQTVSLAGLSPNQILSIKREAHVAALADGKIAVEARTVNGQVVLEDIWILDSKGNRLTGIDVIGKNGEFISVGGPGKNANDTVWLATEKALKALKTEADKKGVKAQTYYERGNSDRFNDLIN